MQSKWTEIRFLNDSQWFLVIKICLNTVSCELTKFHKIKYQFYCNNVTTFIKTFVFKHLQIKFVRKLLKYVRQRQLLPMATIESSEAGSENWRTVLDPMVRMMKIVILRMNRRNWILRTFQKHCNSPLNLSNHFKIKDFPRFSRIASRNVQKLHELARKILTRKY